MAALALRVGYWLAVLVFLSLAKHVYAESHEFPIRLLLELMPPLQASLVSGGLRAIPIAMCIGIAFWGDRRLFWPTTRATSHVITRSGLPLASDRLVEVSENAAWDVLLRSKPAFAQAAETLNFLGSDAVQRYKTLATSQPAADALQLAGVLEHEVSEELRFSQDEERHQVFLYLLKVSPTAAADFRESAMLFGANISTDDILAQVSHRTGVNFFEAFEVIERMRHPNLRTERSSMPQ